MLRKFRENAAGALVVVHNIFPTRHTSMERKRRSEISMSEDDLNMSLRGVGER
jgi:hypothetical protein